MRPTTTPLTGRSAAAAAVICGLLMAGVLNVSAAQAAKLRSCPQVLVNPQPDGSYGAGAANITTVAETCTSARRLIKRWYASGLPHGWKLQRAAALAPSYAPALVLSHRNRFVVIGACAGGGCPGPATPAKPRCGSTSLVWATGISCAQAASTFHSDTARYPGWTCGEMRNQQFNFLCARDRALALFSIGE